MNKSRFGRRAVLQSLAALTVVGTARKSFAADPAPPAGMGFPGGAAPATVIHSELKMLAPNVYVFLQREAAGQCNFSVSNFGEGRRSYDAGVSASRAAAQIDLGKYATWTDPDRVALNMARLYSEFKGTIGPNTDRNLGREAVEEYNQLKHRP